LFDLLNAVKVEIEKKHKNTTQLNPSMFCVEGKAIPGVEDGAGLLHHGGATEAA